MLVLLVLRTSNACAAAAKGVYGPGAAGAGDIRCWRCCCWGSLVQALLVLGIFGAGAADSLARYLLLARLTLVIFGSGATPIICGAGAGARTFGAGAAGAGGILCWRCWC